MRLSINDLISKCDLAQKTMDLVTFTEKKMLIENFIFVQCGSRNPHIIFEASPLSKLICKKGNL